MDKDLSTTYAALSSFFGFLFGVEIGVFWFALTGALVSVRFCETKETKKQLWHIGFSVLLACMVVGGSASVYPAWLSLKLVGLIYGFMILLLAEKVYYAVRDTNLTAKINIIIDKVIAKWIP